MNILVTGGAGFIGSHVVKALLQRGHHVTVVDDLRHGLRENVPDQANFVRLDMMSPAFGEILGRTNFQAIVHLAAQTRVDTAVAKPVYDTAENVLGTVKMLEFARTHGISRFIFASSAAVYGNPDVSSLPLTETEPLMPISFYGYSKATAEGYLQLYAKEFHVSYVALRFANVYGERKNIDDEGGVINVFTRRAANGLALPVYGDGKQSRDYIYVGDIVNGILAALTTDHVNQVYNLSTETEVTLTDIIAMLGKIMGQDLTPTFEPARQGDIYRSLLSHRKAKELLSWEPHMSLEKGLQRLYAYYRDEA